MSKIFFTVLPRLSTGNFGKVMQISGNFRRPNINIKMHCETHLYIALTDVCLINCPYGILTPFAEWGRQASSTKKWAGCEARPKWYIFAQRSCAAGGRVEMLRS